MNYNKKAVYFFCTDYERDEVAPRVLNYLKNNYPLNLRDYKFDNKNIYDYVDEDNNLFTCSGPGNALELSFRLLEKLTSNENVNIIKDNMFLK